MVVQEEWWAPREITFKRGQIEWLLKHLSLLREGIWPANHKESGYVGGNRTQRHSAFFETPCQIAAEIEARLNACGSDGFMVKALYAWGERPEIVAQAFKLDEFNMWKRVERVLKYVSGWKRKRNTFKNFVFHT
ncbi:hypothetical protein [Dehalococcoides mccartyi]|jgi:alkanesulfonate monooxygenase SsuD/methylene tetrahydromethanopterin reductase-like flavin-dependent oxidoreductase (luciferase family)|uniref:hypothetical protein n=1 Tax=Dehalococcoides mccartyi TaxID=61435 RepID=UPI00098ED60A|nr:hypothetical protein [Dehalococcoides mccartyi]AQU06090.1 hypothetical protein B1777_05245 [Dehalococcoides mccartyi]AQU07533.1 hypothetical protein B1778_05045 [Dehalococcoides mccartyi]AQX74779.1 hypothetical protein B1776_04340 [Dehalococcoides mccartyi]AQY73356.1 hypothetical protein B1772_04650 [Dehalococcoides mccartyi]QBX64056.1 hypothetical protein DhcFL2_04675 [Dehalococcoides mccartyi]